MPVWCRHHLARYVDFNSGKDSDKARMRLAPSSVQKKAALGSRSARAVISLHGRVHLAHAQPCHEKADTVPCNGSLEEEEDDGPAAAHTERAGGQSATRLLLPCRLTCLARWSLRMKRRSHSWQQNRFSPV